jgi:hypothetical protein
VEVNSDGSFKGNPVTQNPYWILNRNPVTVSNKNIYGALALSYQINPWLSARVEGTIAGISQIANVIYLLFQHRV